jgi:heme/copper-type cytochrome/quinol oxidase subunit 2
MVDESKKMQYWCIALIIIFVIMIIITFVISGGFAALGTRILLPILNDLFGSGSNVNLIVQLVISIIVIIILVWCLWFGRKKEWF